MDLLYAYDLIEVFYGWNKLPFTSLKYCRKNDRSVEMLHVIKFSDDDSSIESLYHK